MHFRGGGGGGAAGSQAAPCAGGAGPVPEGGIGAHQSPMGTTYGLLSRSNSQA